MPPRFSIPHLTAKACCLLLVVLSHSISSLAQQPANNIAGAYISQDKVRAGIRQTLYRVAETNKVDSIDFAGRYAGKKDAIEKLVEPYLQEEYQTTLLAYPKAATASRGNANNTAYQQAFSKAVERATINAIENNVEIKSVVAPNYSDRILSFHSKINVQQDGTISVSENITIYNGDGSFSTADGYSNNGYINDDIKRGIVRDFPTVYKDGSGFISKVPFKLKGVYKNGKEEPYITKSIGNGERIMIGSENAYLPNGIYTYRIDYETGRQVIFHDNKDELYWNVNGNGWVFTADSISCEITFPEGALIREWACYTGGTGSEATDCKAEKRAPNVIWFSGSKNFDQYEGLTVAASVQKGVIQPPGQKAAMLNFMRDNFVLLLVGLLVIGLFLYYFLVWRKHGKDPAKGTVIPQFEPPPGISPADAGFILSQKYQPRFFAAALVDCAVKNIFKIEVNKKGLLIKTAVYAFKKPDAEKESTHPEDFPDVYGFSPKSFIGRSISGGTYDPFIAGKNNALEARLRSRFEIRRGKQQPKLRIFKLNSCYAGIGILILIAIALIGISYAVTYESWQIGRIMIILWLMALVIHIVFARIMPAYTLEGRQLADHLEGFKMYLETAEKKLFEFFTPPEKTLDLFEKYLPYAIALGVENSWAGKFESLLQKAVSEGYQPSYYHGSYFNARSFSMADMSQGLSSGLSSSISSASTPPSSSSGGSSGGGSSGGGGGGGGGGGW